MARALREDFHYLHAAASNITPSQHNNSWRRGRDKYHVHPQVAASVLILALHAPVLHSGREVEMSPHNRVDDSDATHWARTFFNNANFLEATIFTAYTVCPGDHRLIESTTCGVGLQVDLSTGILGEETHRFAQIRRECQPHPTR